MMGDFNGRYVTKCLFTSKTILFSFPSYNGNRLGQFIQATELTLVNTLTCFTGLSTRVLYDQKSMLDYILVSSSFVDQMTSAFVDGSGLFDLCCDHVTFRINMKISVKTAIRKTTKFV